MLRILYNTPMIIQPVCDSISQQVVISIPKQTQRHGPVGTHSAYKPWQFFLFEKKIAQRAQKKIPICNSPHRACFYASLNPPHDGSSGTCLADEL
jgi:hypothetical protein